MTSYTRHFYGKDNRRLTVTDRGRTETEVLEALEAGEPRNTTKGRQGCSSGLTHVPKELPVSFSVRHMSAESGGTLLRHRKWGLWVVFHPAFRQFRYDWYRLTVACMYETSWFPLCASGQPRSVQGHGHESRYSETAWSIGMQSLLQTYFFLIIAGTVGKEAVRGASCSGRVGRSVGNVRAVGSSLSACIHLITLGVRSQPRIRTIRAKRTITTQIGLWQLQQAMHAPFSLRTYRRLGLGSCAVSKMQVTSSSNPVARHPKLISNPNIQ